MKEVRVAASAGFCFGVKRSVEMAEKLLAEKGSCISYGELIHNEDVVAELMKRGLRIASSPADIGEGDRVIIRAHGVSEATVKSLEAAGAVLSDATCPKVKRIHNIVHAAAEEGSAVLVIGMKNHPEVEAIWRKMRQRPKHFSMITPSFRQNRYVWSSRQRRPKAISIIA